MVGEFLIDKPGLDVLHQALGECGDVHSRFFKLGGAFKPFNPEDRSRPLTGLFEHGLFQDVCADLLPVDNDIGPYATLNRLEFEGSLVSVLMRGGCHGGRVGEATARAVVSGALDAVFPKPWHELRAFRLDNDNWSTLTY